MEEAEVPLEQLQEEIHHHAEDGGAPWISWVALSTAILAVLAAIAGLLSGSHANEAMMSQIKSSDQWLYYQAKSIKAAILDAKTTLASEATDRDKEKAAQYQKEQVDIKREAEQKEEEARFNFHQHEIFARSVTMFQIAIAIAAISALTKKRRFWFVSLVFGLAGVVFLVLGSMAH
jgi:predicted cobalt transporter CbtA